MNENTIQIQDDISMTKYSSLVATCTTVEFSQMQLITVIPMYKNSQITRIVKLYIG